MKIRTIPVGPFQENTYLVVDDDSNVAALVDPGDEAERLLEAVRESGAKLAAIWLTHAHVDHVGAIAGIKRVLDIPVYLHPLDLPLYQSASRHGLVFGLIVDDPPPPDRILSDGDVLELGSLRFTVMHAPGHAPGHVVIHGHGVAFVGDCLFAGSIGRTDLPLADGAALARTLETLCTLPDAMVIYPGHGPASTIGRERADNPFLNGGARILGSV
ncbi:MAG: MBL fold metallo-hydrolase [Gemmatimonadaceae bacterium]